MDHILGHVVRRGMDAHAAWRDTSTTGGDADRPVLDIPPYGIAIIVSTLVLGGVSMHLIEYTYGKLIPTLMMVESPTAVLFESLPNDDPDAPIDSKKSEQTEPDLILVKQQPVTSKMRTTLKHLRERAGVWSRFRAICLFVLYSVALGQLTLFLHNVSIPRGLDGILAATMLARIQMGWTHIAISNPSSKYWFQRLPSIKLWKKVAVPTAILAAAQQVTVLLPAALACTIGVSKVFKLKELLAMADSERNMFIAKLFAVVFVAIFCAIAVVVPASVALTRVQASLLSDKEETIVPFDRSFGGLVGGSGVISSLDAWKTFDMNQRVRLLKLYAKVLFMQISVALLFGAIVGMELHMIMGDQLLKYIMYVQYQN